MIKLYSSKDWLQPGVNYLPLLYPIFGKRDTPVDHDYEFYDIYLNEHKEYIKFTNRQDADFLVFPSHWCANNQEYMEIGRDLIDGDKPVIVFDCSDHRAFPDHPNLIMFKASYERCYETKCKLYGYPVWSGDLLKVHCNSKLKPLPRTDKPKVGFVGLGANMVRSRSIRNLREDNRIEDDIIVRKQFFNGANNYDSKLQSRKEFVDNILRNQYTLAPRGSGNFSFRFYEAMCLGRIPILIDSSCVLPYPGIDEIERYIPVCRRNSINDVVDRVVEYHRNNNIEENQKVCRDLWEKYFSPHGFYRNMVGYLSNHIS